MLGGFVFLSHQIGCFLGVWLGGRLYDMTGSYDVVWWIAVALGVFAALVNLPVRETRDRCARRPRHEAGADAPRALALGRGALALALVLRRLPAARPRGRPRQPAVELLLGPPAHRATRAAPPRPGCCAGRT